MKSWREPRGLALLNGYTLRNGDESKRRQNWGRTELTWGRGARRLGGEGESGERGRRGNWEERRETRNGERGQVYPPKTSSHIGVFAAFIVTTESQHLKMKISIKCEGSVHSWRELTKQGDETSCSFPFPSRTPGRAWRPRSPAPSPVHRRLVVGIEGPGEGARRHLKIHGVGQHRHG